MSNFSVCNWNVENLFRPANNKNLRRYQRKLGLLSEVILQNSPDVLALQEIGGEGPLQDLQEALQGQYPHRCISDFPDGRGIRVAFLSKLAIKESEDIVDFPAGSALDVQKYDEDGDNMVPVTRMGRGALRIRVSKGRRTVDVITVHLKSKLLTFPRPGRDSCTPRNEDERTQSAGIALNRRTAEAATVRLRINSLLETANHPPCILLGDLNDVPEAQTSLILAGPPGSQIGTRGFNRPDKGDAARLFNLTYAIEDPTRRYSRIYRGKGEMLDQILVSEEMLPVGADNRRRIPIVDSIVDFKGRLSSIGDNPGDRVDDIAPDHAPVVAVFES